MMIESSFPGTDGKSIIHSYRMEMQGAPSAILQIVQGMSEYFLRYEGFAEYLAGQGILVTGHDQVALRLYEDMRHEILNEKGQAAVYGDIRDFIRDVIGTDGSAGE